MARATRMALDIALFSLRKVGPVVSTVWYAAKNYVAKTKAKPLVCNPVVRKAENVLDAIHEKVISKFEEARTRLLPRELKYLEKEIERVKRQLNGTTSKTLKPIIGTAWQYAKVEMIPPMTSQLFQGPFGKRLENAASSAADSFITNLNQKIKDIEAEKARIIKEKEAAIKAAAEKVKAEAIKKAEEQKRLEAEKAAAIAKKAKEKAKKSEVEKKAATTKAETKSAKTESKEKATRVATKTKKKAKNTRREVKKGSAPKPKK